MKKIGENEKIYLIGMIIGEITLGLATVITDTIINSTYVSYKTTTVRAVLNDLYGLTANDVWQKIYLVGSIYISAVSTSLAAINGSDVISAHNIMKPYITVYMWKRTA